VERVEEMQKPETLSAKEARKEQAPVRKSPRLLSPEK